MIVISPYARHGYVSHVQHEFGSILHFTEERLSLGSLGASDVARRRSVRLLRLHETGPDFVALHTGIDAAYFERDPAHDDPPDND